MFTHSRALNGVLRRAYSQVKPGGSSRPNVGSASSGASSSVVNATGLSTKCVKSVTGPVGPGAAPNAEYKVPEYFCFNRFSYHEAEVEMAKFRCPQPSALKK